MRERQQALAILRVVVVHDARVCVGVDNWWWVLVRGECFEVVFVGRDLDLFSNFAEESKSLLKAAGRRRGGVTWNVRSSPIPMY